MPEHIVATPGDTDARYRLRRAARHEARRLLWRITRLKRVAYCGRVVTDKSAGVTVKLTGQAGDPTARAGFSGLQTCGSVWACPVCSEKVNAHRQLEVQTALEKHLANGGAAVFGTFTVRHRAGDALADLWDAVAPAWHKVTNGASWWGGKRQTGDKTRFGIEGWCRVVEVKHGEHGWHPHIHAIFFLARELDDQALDDMRGRLFGRWAGALGRAGFDAMEFDKDGHAVAVDLRRVTDGEALADYFAKNTYGTIGTTPGRAAYEVTGSQSKTAGKGGRTPFQILAALVSVKQTVAGDVDVTTGEILDAESTATVARDLLLWRDWEQTSSGRRQLTWSRGLRDKLLGGVELTDEEAAAEEELGGTPITYISALDWKLHKMWRASEEILQGAEDGTLDEVLSRLRSASEPGG